MSDDKVLLKKRDFRFFSGTLRANSLLAGRHLNEGRLQMALFPRFTQFIAFQHEVSASLMGFTYFRLGSAFEAFADRKSAGTWVVPSGLLLKSLLIVKIRRLFSVRLKGNRDVHELFIKANTIV